MLNNNYNVNFPETLNLAIVDSAVCYTHLGPQARILSWAAALNGSAIDSGADVIITLTIPDVGDLGTITLPPGMMASECVIEGGGSKVIPKNAVISATVTTAATIAAGSASVTLCLSNG